MKGGEAGGTDGVEEETSARRAGLALHWRGQKEERKSLSHPSFLSSHLSVSAFSSPPVFTLHLDSLYPFFQFSTPLLASSHCLSLCLSSSFFPPRLGVSSFFSSSSLTPFIVLYLSSPPSFHFCLFVYFSRPLISTSFHQERAWREIYASAV